VTQTVEPTAIHDATTIRELTANETNSVTGGFYNVGAWMRAADKDLQNQDKMGNFESTSSF